MSAVTGPRIAGPRGTGVRADADLAGSIIMVGLTTPVVTRPLAEISATGILLDVAGPLLRKPPEMELAITRAEPLSGLPPRADGMPVPVSEMTPALMKLPPEAVGQVKPAGLAASLAQELMAPLIWMPVRPAPAPDISPPLTKLPFTLPSIRTTTELDCWELTLPFWMMPPPPKRMLLVILVPWVNQKATELSPWISMLELWVVTWLTWVVAVSAPSVIGA